MLYLLDASVLITAQNSYYPLDQFPEFWEWLLHQASIGNIKIPVEIMEEVLAGRRENDPLLDWLNDSENKCVLSLEEEADISLVQRVTSEGYAPDLTDIEIEQVGRDPFLIAYALADMPRSIVTVEGSKPSKTRHNRKIPDVCNTFSVPCYNPFDLNRQLGFRTGWKG